MMQQIATKDSNIAAIGLSPEQDANVTPALGEEFKQLFKEQDRNVGRPVEPIERPDKVIEKQQKTSETDSAESTTAKHEKTAETQDNEASSTENSDVSARDKASTERESEDSANAEEQVTKESADTVNQAEDDTQAVADTEQVKEDAIQVDWLNLVEQSKNHSEMMQSALQVAAKDDQAQQQKTLESYLSELLTDVENNELKLSDDENRLVALLAQLQTALEAGESQTSEQQTNEELLASIIAQLTALQNEDGESDVDLPTLDEQELLVDLELLASMVVPEEVSEESDKQVPLFVEELTKEPAIDVSSVDDKALAALLALPENKLEKALEKLADKLPIESLERKQSQLPELQRAVADNAGQQNSDKQDFIASLKAGIEELKAQLKQGHEPGINLKSLIASTMNAMAQSEQIAPVPMEKLDSVLSKLGRSLEMGGMVQQLADSTVAQSAIDRPMQRESQVSQMEQARQLHQSANVDRAINIVRPEGHQQLVEKVRWMMGQNNLQADIRLDPPELGSMKIRVNLSGEAASVNFVVQSQQAREVLEQATPRLKELLEEQGIELGQSSVEQEQGDSNTDEDGQLADKRNGADEDENESVVSEQPVRRGVLGAN